MHSLMCQYVCFEKKNFQVGLLYDNLNKKKEKPHYFTGIHLDFKVWKVSYIMPYSITVYAALSLLIFYTVFFIYLVICGGS